MIAVLVNPSTPIAEGYIRNAQGAASAKGVRLQVLKASAESEIDAAFATLVQLHIGAVIVVADPFLDGRREQLVTLAARDAVPVIYALREFALAGGLISYGVSFTATFRQAGGRAAVTRLSWPRRTGWCRDLQNCAHLDTPLSRAGRTSQAI